MIIRSRGRDFITIVTDRRALSFGRIGNAEMQLNDPGKIANECWRAIPEHFSNVELGTYVIMPNHVHGSIIIRADASAFARSTIYRAPTEQFQKPIVSSIPTIIRTYKAAVTRCLGREFNVTGTWQRNYCEHVIRNEQDLQNKTAYIQANPMLWDQDDENPATIKP